MKKNEEGVVSPAAPGEITDENAEKNGRFRLMHKPVCCNKLGQPLSVSDLIRTRASNALTRPWADCAHNPLQ